MKRIITTLIALSLILTMGITSMAEIVEPESETAANSEIVLDEDSTELEEARAAYRAAKQAGRMTDYEAELEAMVAAGTLTREQADLLLTAAKEQEALANGECPNCGYTFRFARTGKAGGKMRGTGMQSGKRHGGRR